jgi:hypothetical protein
MSFTFEILRGPSALSWHSVIFAPSDLSPSLSPDVRACSYEDFTVGLHPVETFAANCCKTERMKANEVVRWQTRRLIFWHQFAV